MDIPYLPYYSLKEVEKYTGLNQDQVLRLVRGNQVRLSLSLSGNVNEPGVMAHIPLTPYLEDGAVNLTETQVRLMKYFLHVMKLKALDVQLTAPVFGSIEHALAASEHRAGQSSFIIDYTPYRYYKDLNLAALCTKETLSEEGEQATGGDYYFVRASISGLWHIHPDDADSFLATIESDFLHCMYIRILPDAKVLPKGFLSPEIQKLADNPFVLHYIQEPYDLCLTREEMEKLLGCIEKSDVPILRATIMEQEKTIDQLQEKVDLLEKQLAAKVSPEVTNTRSLNTWRRLLACALYCGYGLRWEQKGNGDRWLKGIQDFNKDIQKLADSGILEGKVGEDTVRKYLTDSFDNVVNNQQ